MRYKALAALAVLGVLISAGSVGSQDPLRARAEAESLESAIPITAPDPSDPRFNPYLATSRATPSLVRARSGAIALPPAARPVMPGREQPVATRNLLQPIKLALATATLKTSRDHATLPGPAPVVAATSLVKPQSSVDTTLAIAESVPLSVVAERRLFRTVPDEIEPYFDLFMYVSKSNRGPLAQRMFVFQRNGDGVIVPYAEWKVSTGREKVELHKERRVRTTTPEGLFALNPKRFYKRYWSTSWDNAPMHYAMFYDFLNNGRQSGLAIHAVSGQDKIRKLGRRDSAGCIRLAPKQAKELFYKVRNTTQGRVPVLAVNERGSTDRWGRVEVDETGTMLLQDGYRVLVFVENFDGRDELMSPVVAYIN
jgi:hypothetical protein